MNPDSEQMDDSNHDSFTTLSDITMDATSSSSSDDRVVASARRRQLPTKKRKIRHPEPPLFSKRKAVENDDEGGGGDVRPPERPEQQQQQQKQQPKKREKKRKKKKKKRRRREPLENRGAERSSSPPAPEDEEGAAEGGDGRSPEVEAAAPGPVADGYFRGEAGSAATVSSLPAPAPSSASDAVAVRPEQEAIRPRLNDVLMGDSSPAAFHHIGNRRFRVLVEANLDAYFSDLMAMTPHQLLANGGINEAREPTEEQRRVVENIVKCVEGNIPAGRFLVPISDDEDGGESLDWKFAPAEEVATKVHSTFLAAARFHVNQNAAALVRHLAAASQMGELSRGWEESAEAPGLDEAVAAVQAAAATMDAEVDGKNASVSAQGVVETSSQDADAASREGAEAGGGARGSEAAGASGGTAAPYSPTPAPGAADSPDGGAETAASGDGAGDYQDVITNALSKYHAKNREVVAEQMLSVSAAASAASRAWPQGHQYLAQAAADVPAPAPAAADPSGNDLGEVAYLAKEATRLNAILSRGGPKGMFKERMDRTHAGHVAEHQRQAGNDTGRRQQAEGIFQGGDHAGLLRNLFPGIVPSYLPARNPAGSGRAASSEGTREAMAAATAAGAAPIVSSAPGPSSIGEPCANPAGTTRSPFSSRANSEISISPQPPHRAAPPAVALAPGSSKEPVEKRARDAVASDGAPPPAPLQCPARIKVFLALPIDRFFVRERDAAAAASPYVVPSNYDVLCGHGQSFFHHVGNRRFRIMIEMNAGRYEEAYQAASAGGARRSSSSIDSLASPNEYEGSIQKLINEVLISLSRCDPPGRFLGMDMSTGRWRPLNPVFAQLKTEQTFFECMRVKRRRRARLQEEVGRLEEEWKRRLEHEKERLLEELEGRMQISSSAAGGRAGSDARRRRATVDSGVSSASEVPLAARRRVSQASPPDGALCPAGGFRPALAEEDLMTLQEQAKNLLRRRQAATPHGGQPCAAAGAEEEPGSFAVPEAVLRLARERAEATLESAREYGPPRPLPFASSSFSGRPRAGGGVGGGAGRGHSSSDAMRAPRRGSNCSRESDSSSGESSYDRDDAAAVDPPAAPCARRHREAPSPSSDDGDGRQHRVKDLLDVVGGMMMMSRRGSANLVPLDNN